MPASSQTGHTIYDPTKSSTFNQLQGTFNITYGDGSFSSGPVGLDTVDIGGATVAQQAIGLPNLVASSFVADTSSNGLVGLAFSKLNTIQPTPQKTFFDNVMANLTQPVFTASLKHGTAGSYEFGTIDTSLFTGNLNTVPVDSSQGFWEFESTAGAVAGQTVNIPNGLAIADTGTSLMLVGDNLLVAYWNQVQGAQLSQAVGGVIFPCNANLPDLQVAIGNTYMATISGNLMNFSAVGTDTATGTNCKSLPKLAHPRRQWMLTIASSLLWWVTVQPGPAFLHLWRCLLPVAICRLRRLWAILGSGAAFLASYQALTPSPTLPGCIAPAFDPIRYTLCPVYI